MFQIDVGKAKGCLWSKPALTSKDLSEELVVLRIPNSKEYLTYLASSEKAWKALKSRLMKRRPPRVKAPADVFGKFSQTVPKTIAMTIEVIHETTSCALS